MWFYYIIILYNFQEYYMKVLFIPSRFFHLRLFPAGLQHFPLLWAPSKTQVMTLNLQGRGSWALANELRNVKLTHVQYLKGTDF